MLKKFIVILLLILVSSLFLVADILKEKKDIKYPNYCGGKTTINVYSWLPKSAKLLNIFEKQFPNIQINWIKLEKKNYRGYIIEKLKNNEDYSIDVFQVNLWDLPLFVNTGLALNLSNQNIDPYVIEIFDKKILEAVSRTEPIYAVTGNPCYSCNKIVIGKKDMIYGIPFEISGFAVLYKKEIQKKSRKFKNWEEFLDFLNDVRRKNGKIALLDYPGTVSKLLKYFRIIPKSRKNLSMYNHPSVQNLVKTLFSFLKYTEPLLESQLEHYGVIIDDYNTLSILKNDFNSKRKKWELKFIPFPLEKDKLITGSAFCVGTKSNNITASLLFSLWLCIDNHSARYFQNLGIFLANKYKPIAHENLNMLPMKDNFMENQKYFEYFEKYISNLVKRYNNPKKIVQLISEKYIFVKYEKGEPQKSDNH